MGDTLHKAAAIAAVVILLILAVMVRVPARSTSQNMASRDRHRKPMNTPVNVVPPSDVRVHSQQANHRRREDVRRPRPQPAPDVRPPHSVASLRSPPPAYLAPHLDARSQPVGYGYYGIGNSRGGAVDVVPPPYTADPGGDGQPL